MDLAPREISWQVATTRAVGGCQFQAPCYLVLGEVLQKQVSRNRKKVSQARKMKRITLTSVPIFLTLSPVLFALIWHIRNLGWPNDDPANYMLTAYQQYSAFRNGSIVDGLQAMYRTRGWRPTVFPLVATPFLLLSNGSVLIAVASALVLCFLVVQGYLYAIARRYLDPLRASLIAAFVGSSQAIAIYSTIFFSEMAWLAVYAGFVFHVLESSKFERPSHASIAGLFLGCALIIRPAETLLITTIPVLSLLYLAVRQDQYLIPYIVRVVGFILLNGLVLIVAIMVSDFSYKLVLGCSFMISVMHLFLIKKYSNGQSSLSGLNHFAMSVVLVNILWWAKSMPQLYSWVYETSFGSMAKVTDVAAQKEGSLKVLMQICSFYLFPNGIMVALLGMLPLLPFRREKFDNVKRLSLLALLTLGFLIPMCALYVATETSDSRRVFIGMTFLLTLLAILSLQEGSFRRARFFGFVFILALQLNVLFCAVKGEAISFGNLFLQKMVIPYPDLRGDKNEEVIFCLLKLGMPKGSTIAVYTTALFQPRDRVYEPAALQLAAFTTGSNFNIIYYWDIGDYSSVLERLRRDQVEYLLIDKHQDPNSSGKHQPSWIFATTLLDKMEKMSSDPPGLKQIDVFELEGREQVLFKILAP